MDSTAVETIAQLAIEAHNANQLPTHTPAIILKDMHGGQTIDSLEIYQAHRSRYRGVFNTDNLTHFATHVITTVENGNVEGQAQGFIEPNNMHATVFFNLGSLDKPGHADHRAVLKLTRSAAYSAMLSACSKHHDQRSLHDFIEDWRDYITPVYGDNPDNTKLASALAAVRDITVEKARSEKSVVSDFGGQRSAMESVDAKSTLVLPSALDFICVPYADFPIRAFRLRLGVNTGGDKLSLTLRQQQAEQHTEQLATDFHTALETKLGTNCTLTLGTFNP